ncbi:MAG: 50S ribosomal protein L13 [Deltaproteobacteria bacterium]|nr:50S ribosomal protein L13 [Deltaproteobacteria bacterium]
MKTVHIKNSDVNRRWLLVDVEDKVLGRVASNVASILRGKTSPKFTPHVDTGDFVIVVNAAKIKLTGKKWQDKMYHDHSGHPSGLKSKSAATMLEKHPTDIFRRAVKGMLPKSALGYSMIRKLKIYAGPEHPHEAQKPEQIDFEGTS